MLVVLILQRVVIGIIDLFGGLVSGTADSIWHFLVTQLVWLDIFLAAGVFLALCFVRPVVSGLRVVPVVIRSVLAAAAGFILVFLAGARTGHLHGWNLLR